MIFSHFRIIDELVENTTYVIYMCSKILEAVLKFETDPLERTWFDSRFDDTTTTFTRPPSWVSNAVYALTARGAAQSVVEKDDVNPQSPYASSPFPKR
jgi:hypothetical protein